MQEERDCYIGQIFGMMSVLRSQCDQGKISVSTKYMYMMIYYAVFSSSNCYMYTGMFIILW